jgi:hypothetical protein
VRLFKVDGLKVKKSESRRAESLKFEGCETVRIICYS